MEFFTAAVSDVGIKKKINQDAVILKVASSGFGRIVLAVICDGMGGLAKGELASATMLHETEGWFTKILPAILQKDRREEEMYNSLLYMTQTADSRMKKYVEKSREQMGTTLCVLLIVDRQYFTFSVGDSRIYLHNGKKLSQITKDHTLVQREIDNGRMTVKEAERSPDRSVLSQCVGASPVLQPDYTTGFLDEGTVFIVCSDGFRHVVTLKEMQKAVNPRELSSEKKMEERLECMVETIKKRKEEDNISAIWIKAF